MSSYIYHIDLPFFSERGHAAIYALRCMQSWAACVALNASHCDFSFPFLIVNQLCNHRLIYHNLWLRHCWSVVAACTSTVSYRLVTSVMSYHVGWSTCARPCLLSFNSNSVIRPGAHVAASPALDCMYLKSTAGIVECLKAGALLASLT